MFKSQRKMVYFSVDELLINCLICSKIYQSNEKNEKKKKRKEKNMFRKLEFRFLINFLHGAKTINWVTIRVMKMSVEIYGSEVLLILPREVLLVLLGL